MKLPEKRIVNLEERPDLAGLVEHIGYSYLRHHVEIRRNGEIMAVLLDPQAARCALAIADRLRHGRPPFTHDAFNKWLDEVLEGLDVDGVHVHPDMSGLACGGISLLGTALRNSRLCGLIAAAFGAPWGRSSTVMQLEFHLV
jgi:hypothetical protein